MAAYITTGRSRLSLLSPTPKFSASLLSLQDRLDREHEKYDQMRCNDGRTWMPAKLNDATREQGKKIAKLQSEYQAQFERENPEYVKHWRKTS